MDASRGEECCLGEGMDFNPWFLRCHASLLNGAIAKAKMRLIRRCIDELFHMHHQLHCQRRNKWGLVRLRLAVATMHPVARLTLGSCMLCSDCRFGPIGVQKFRSKNSDCVDCNEYREASV